MSLIDAYNIVGNGNSVVYSDLFIPALVAFGLLGIFVVRCLRHMDKKRFIISFSAVFCIAVVSELFFFYEAVRNRYDAWLDAFTKTATAYANASAGLDYWKIDIGNENLFSDWSPAVVPKRADNLTAPQKTAAVSAASSAEKQKLPVPKNLTAFQAPESLYSGETFRQQQRNQWGIAFLTDNNETFADAQEQIAVHWEHAAEATAYRLQWKRAETDWCDVYTGSHNGCVLQIPKNILIELRVRAENGTAEDDPLFLRLVMLYETPITANPMLCSVYALRYTEGTGWRYLAAPLADSNHNGRIDKDEIPVSVGDKDERLLPLFEFIQREHLPGVSTLAEARERNNRFSAAVPLWKPDGSFDGLIGFDFHAGMFQQRLHRGRTAAFIGFLLTLAFLFGGGSLLLRLQRSKEELHKVNESLEFTLIELRETIRAAQKTKQVKTNLLMQMSREIRTQLTGILGFAHLAGRRLLQQCSEEEHSESKLWIDSIADEGRSLLTLLGNFLDYTSADGEHKVLAEIVPVNVKELIQNIAEVMRPRLENKPVTLSVIEYGSVPQFILSDPVRIRQVLINLIGNAVKFTQQGEVHLEYGTEQASAFWNSITELDSEETGVVKSSVYFTISDTGIGIEPERLYDIFLPPPDGQSLQNKRYGGTGIGLSVSKKSAEALGGSILVTSELGRGSSFSFTLPVWTSDSEAALLDFAEKKNLGAGRPKVVSVTQTIPAKQLKGRRVLIVEDGRINQMIIKAQLTETGAEAVIAENGQEALDAVAAGKDRPFDVILMDIGMPVMDGYETVKILRKTGYTRPVIAVTAHNLDSDREKILNSGFDAFVPKPIDRKLLIDTVQKYLN
jgi:signal transduction histidine kinase